jgi:hypothetical protein
MGQIVLFGCLIGLRPAEVVEAARLINSDNQTFQAHYKPERVALEHFRFSNVFFRHTKKTYISFATPEMLEIVKGFAVEISPTSKFITYNAIMLACRKRGINMDMRFCSKVHGSWLHQHGGTTSEAIDFLHGRVSTSVFSRHYLTPDFSLRTRVLDAVGKLKQEIEH